MGCLNVFRTKPRDNTFTLNSIWAGPWGLMSYANSKGAVQPAHPRSLISACVVHCLDSIISLDYIAEISRLQLASVAAQASLCLAWSETPEDTFCRVMDHILEKPKVICNTGTRLMSLLVVLVGLGRGGLEWIVLRVVNGYLVKMNMKVRMTLKKMQIVDAEIKKRISLNIWSLFLH